MAPAKPAKDAKIYLPAGTVGKIVYLRLFYHLGKHKRHWYQKAQEFVEETAKLSGLSPEVVAAVVAVISPSVRWDINMAEASKIIHAFVTGGTLPRGAGWKRNREKAWRILQTGDTSLVTGPKVTSFYRNLLGQYDELTLDRHAYKAWLNLRQPGKVQAAASVHRLCERDYRLLAEYYGEEVAEVQWKVWEGYRESVGL